MGWKAVAALALLAASMGSLAVSAYQGALGPHGDSDPAREIEAEATAVRSSSSNDVSQEKLESGRLSTTADADRWAAQRLVLTEAMWDSQHWAPDGGEAWFEIAIAADPRAGATPTLKIASFQPEAPFALQAPVTLPGGQPSVETLNVSVQCPGDCGEAPPELELAFIQGSMGASTTYHLAIPTEPLPEDPPAALDRIEDRERLDVAPDATGDGVASGTYALRVDEDGTLQQVERGHIEVDTDRSPLLEPERVDRHLDVDVDAAAEGGSAQLIAYLNEHAGVQDWSIQAQVGPAQTNGWGVSAHRPQAESQASPVGVRDTVGYPPAAIVDARPGDGLVSLDLDAQFSGLVGAETEHLATWGWASANLTKLYGWPHQALAENAGGPSQSVDGIHLKSTAEGPAVCSDRIAETCLTIPLAR